jgi:hypothetical protein
VFQTTGGTLSSDTYEFNASFRTADQSSGTSSEAVSAGVIAKNLRDAINEALFGHWSVRKSNLSSGSFTAINATTLTVGDIKRIGSLANSPDNRGMVHDGGDFPTGGTFVGKQDSNYDLIAASANQDDQNKIYQQYVFEISS